MRMAEVEQEYKVYCLTHSAAILLQSCVHGVFFVVCA